MAYLNPSNCTVDKNSGGIVFHGTPETRAIAQVQKQLNRLEAKLDLLIQSLPTCKQENQNFQDTHISPS